MLIADASLINLSVTKSWKTESRSLMCYNRSTHLATLLMASALFLIPPVTWAASAQQIYQLNLPSVVSVLGRDEFGNVISVGSGFYVTESGDVATNLHVVANSKHITVRRIGSEEEKEVHQIKWISKESDIAVLTTNGDSKAVNLSDQLPQVGSAVVAIGNPAGLEGSISEGIVGGIRKSPNKPITLIQITAPISPGSSGGPLFNEEGAVVGITTSTLLGYQNLNFAVPASKLIHLMSQEPANLRVAQLLDDRIQKSALSSDESTMPVRLIGRHIKFDPVSGGYLVEGRVEIEFSIHNATRHPVQNIQLLLVWYPAEYYKIDDRLQSRIVRGSLPLHYAEKTFATSYRIKPGLSRYYSPVEIRPRPPFAEAVIIRIVNFDWGRSESPRFAR